MRCSKIEAYLVSHVDGQLRGPERDAVEAHLAGCAACRAVVEEMRAVRDALRALGPVRPPASFAPRVRAAVRAEMARALPPAMLNPAFRAFLPSAALALMAVATLSWYLTGPQRVYVAPASSAARTHVTPRAVPLVAPRLVVASLPQSPPPVERASRRASRVRQAALGEPSLDSRPPEGAAATPAVTSKAVPAPKAPPPPTPAASARPVTLLASTDARMTEAAASESPAVFDASPRGLEAPAPAVAVAPLPAASGGQVTLVSLLTDQGLDQPSM